MATLTKGTTFASGDVVTPAKLNNLVDAATVTNIQTADIADSQITAPKIATNSVTTSKIADSNVTTEKIANGAVTSAKLGNDILFVPAGAVMPFAMNSAPSGWLAANGSEVSRTTYATLFAVIGTTYGSGNGSTTFNLPDLRGYFVRGSGTNSDGTASAAFGTKQNDELKSHTHLLFADAFSADGSKVSISQQAAWASTNDGREDYHIGGVTNNATLGNSSSVGGTETRPKNIALLYCIKF